MNKEVLIFVWAIFLLGSGLISPVANAGYELTLQQKQFIAEMLNTPKSLPGISISVPTGFGASSGQIFASIGGITTDERNGTSNYDGAANVGMGVGNPAGLGALEMQVNIISLTNNGPKSGVAEEGTFSGKLSKQLSSRSAIAIGVEDFANWGAALDKLDPSYYLVYTLITNISGLNESPWPLSLTFGVGNKRFQDIEHNKRQGSVGFFGSVALAVHRQIGLISEHNGNYFNSGISFVPLKKYPLTVTFSAVNLNEVSAKFGGTVTGETEFGGSVGYSWQFN